MDEKSQLEKKTKVIEFAESIGCNWRDEGGLLVISFPTEELTAVLRAEG